MRNLAIATALLACTASALAEPPEALVDRLRESMVKVHVDTRGGGRGLGSGVVVSENFVATNCHVLGNTGGVGISKRGVYYIPVALKADWKHDICLLRFENLPLAPVPLGDSRRLRYEQRVFSIGYPLAAVRPLVTHGKIKGLYQFHGSPVIRASSSFRLGASGSAMLDENGALIGINTFMSPGPRNYFYSMPVDWIKALLVSGDETTSLAQKESPFWDAPEEEQPYFMRVVIPALGEHWQTLAEIAGQWCNAEPDSAEAWYYLGLAEERRGNDAAANVYLQKALSLNPQHADALLEIGMIASRLGNEAELRRVALILDVLDIDAAATLRKATASSN